MGAFEDLERIARFFAQRDFAEQNPQGKKCAQILPLKK
jgi:hypothetical protein